MEHVTLEALVNPYGIVDTFAEDLVIEFLPSGSARLNYFTVENGQLTIVARILRPLSTVWPNGRIMRTRNKGLM